jgi:hypothetical protein
VVPDTGPDEPALVTDGPSGALQGRAAVPPVYGWSNRGVPSRTNWILWGRGWWWRMQRTGPMRYFDLAAALC